MAAAPLINPSVASQGEMWTMLMRRIPSADGSGQADFDASRAMGALTFRDACGLYPCGDTQPGVRFRIGRLENESGSFPSALGRSGRRERMIVSGGLGECALARGGQKHFWPENSDPLSGYQRVCTFKPLMFRIGAPTADTQRDTHHSSEA